MPTIDRVEAIASIPPTRLVRRRHAKRWHLVDETKTKPLPDYTHCGQRIRLGHHKTAYSANEVDCYDCLSNAISRKLSERGGATQ